jgi:hypothetical protein
LCDIRISFFWKDARNFVTGPAPHNKPDENFPISDVPQADKDRFLWEKHSNGVASKILKKMGFKGKGLGKKEDGIINPIQFNVQKFMENNQVKRKSIYIASDSLLNQMDGDRLSRTFDVKVKSVGGCTIQRMILHLPEIIKSKPDHVIYHIGTNDVVNKTSDEVLEQIHTLIQLTRKLLPTTNVIFSSLINRSDNTKANTIIKNLNYKLKRTNYRLLDNSNITFKDLSRKGLHLNIHGKKKMAKNLISLIKRL